MLINPGAGNPTGRSKSSGAFTSSSAFFIDAAANTMIDFCCAAAGIADNASVATASIMTWRDGMAVLRSRD